MAEIDEVIRRAGEVGQPAIGPAGVDPRRMTPQGAIFNPGEGWVALPSPIQHLLPEFTARRPHDR